MLPLVPCFLLLTLAGAASGAVADSEVAQEASVPQEANESRADVGGAANDRGTGFSDPVTAYFERDVATLAKGVGLSFLLSTLSVAAASGASVGLFYGTALLLGSSLSYGNRSFLLALVVQLIVVPAVMVAITAGAPALAGFLTGLILETRSCAWLSSPAGPIAMVAAAAVIGFAIIAMGPASAPVVVAALIAGPVLAGLATSTAWFCTANLDDGGPIVDWGEPRRDRAPRFGPPLKRWGSMAY